MAFISQKTVIDFRALADEINRRNGTDYSPNYIANIHSGRQKSKPVSDAIALILSEEAGK